MLAETEDEDAEEFSFRPEERLACDITVCLAEMTAERLDSVGFHISPEEHEQLYKRIRLSGKRVRDYMAQAGITSKVVVVGNESLRKRIEDMLKDIVPELKKWEKAEDIDPVVIQDLKMIFELTETWE